MNRDWDLIRKILLTVADAPPGAHLVDTAFPGEDPAQLFQHVRLLTEKGYLHAKVRASTRLHATGGDFLIERLAWDGHDLLAQMRSEPWWASIKRAAAERGLELTFDVVKVLALPSAAAVLGF